jgi:hypothetical protein
MLSIAAERPRLQIQNVLSPRLPTSVGRVVLGQLGLETPVGQLGRDGRLVHAPSTSRGFGHAATSRRSLRADSPRDRPATVAPHVWPTVGDADVDGRIGGNSVAWSTGCVAGAAVAGVGGGPTDAVSALTRYLASRSAIPESVSRHAWRG